MGLPSTPPICQRAEPVCYPIRAGPRRGSGASGGMADALASGASAQYGRGGSTPLSRTTPIEMIMKRPSVVGGILKIMSDYHYRNLTSAVKDKGSPLRQHLDRRFPNTRPLQADYKQQCGSLLVNGGDANPGTLGAAFDFMIRFILDPDHKPAVAVQAFLDKPPLLAPVVQVVAAAHTSMTAGDADALARASWALALCTEVYRVGGVLPGSPLALLLQQREFTADALLSLASEGAMRQLRDLRKVAEERPLPSILPATRLDLGPTFDGSALCPADADLIHDGRLLDIKTHLGALNKRTGARSDSLSLTDLYQVLAYALFDRTDVYAIRSLGIYSARYGALVTWPLSEALESMAGTSIDMAVEREVVWGLLNG